MVKTGKLFDDVALERDLTDFVERFSYVLNDSVQQGPLMIPAWKSK